MKINHKKFSLLQENTHKKRALLLQKKQNLQTAMAELAEVKENLRKELSKTSQGNINTVSKLQKKQERLVAKISGFRSDIAGIDAEISDLIGQILFSIDPRDQVANLDDSVPVFLMPLRIETRFMTVKHIARINREKIVTSEAPKFTVIDGRPVSLPKRYSVQDVFTGRSEIPVIQDAHELWIRIFPDDIAIHTHESLLTVLEIEAAKTFWIHMWYAGDDESLQIGAWRGLVSGRGPERAAWIAKQMQPTNPQDKPATAVDPVQNLPADPIFSSPAIKDGSWSQAPHTKVLPERFVARLFVGSNYREIVGEPVPDSLQLGLDPLAATDEITSKNGLLEMSDKLRWMKDFEEAEKVGMGIRVPLLFHERFRGFDKILVLGVKTSTDKNKSQALLEELLNNHHYKHGGFSIVAQGTPTNNTEDAKSGYTALNNDDEDLFNIELKSALFNPTTTDLDKTDGQHLADALGISYDVLQHIRNADHTDTKEAICMNRALWPVTLGYYLSQMMYPIFPKSDVSRIRSHFNQYVLGRGRAPAIRIDNQPYGILPTTAFSKWNYRSNDANTRFLNNLHKKVLKNMETTWDGLSQQVKYAGANVNPSDFNDHFLEIMGLHASSVEYYQRFVIGPYFLWNVYNYSNLVNKEFAFLENASYATSFDFTFLFGTQNIFLSLPPRVFDFFYLKDHKHLDGPVIDTLKLSESRTIKPMGSKEENYIDWLIQSNWAQIKAENFSNIGAPGAAPPTALLYLMLRHAALLEYLRTGLTLLVEHGILTDTALLDTELLNLGITGQISPEIKNLVRAQVQLKENLLLDQKLEQNVEKEFAKRAATGALEGMDLKSLNRIKTAFKAELRAAASPSLDEKVEAELDKVITSFETSVNKIESITTTYDFLQGISVADYIAAELTKPKVDQALLNMQELIEAMKCLRGVPTARLERCFAEHIDLASYRLDSWVYSLVLERLQQLRKSGNSRATGIYLGAYSWLENVRPSNFPGIHYREVDITPNKIVVPGYLNVVLEGIGLQGEIGTVKPWIAKEEAIIHPTKSTTARVAPITSEPAYGDQILMMSGGGSITINEKMQHAYVDTPLFIDVAVLADLGPQYIYLGTDSVGDITYDSVTNKFIHRPRIDPKNQGYIHAPSINHATAAAVLRAGYETYNNGVANNKLAVNLSSDRVRRALYLGEGMKNGQELAALLGYQFERGLHDRDEGLDAHILEVRTKYPLVAGRVTDNTGVTSATDAEAYNVVNGLDLLENSRDPIANYPYGVAGLPNAGTAKTAIIEEVSKMHDALDALSDLMMSESMYQVVLGNFARASGAMNAMSGQTVVPNPEVIRTPRTFHILSHRMGIRFDLSPNGHAIWTALGTPRSLAEPYLNRWLGEMLPDKYDLLVNYQYRVFTKEGFPGSVFENNLTLGNLGIEPVDLYYILTQPSEQGDAVELVNRIGYHIRKNIQMEDNIAIEVLFTFRTGFSNNQISLFELQPLMDQLKSVVGNGRPSRAQDFLLSSGAETVIAANPTKGLDTTPLLNRLNNVIGSTMSNGDRGLAGAITDIQTEVAAINDLIVNVGYQGVDATALIALRNALMAAAMFGAQNAIPQSAVDSSETIINDLLLLAARVLVELSGRHAAAAALLTNVGSAPTEDQKLTLLGQAAQQIFGRAFKVHPEYRLYNETPYQAALDYSDYLKDAPPFAVEEWLQGLSPVRKRIHAYHQARLLSQTLKTTDGHLTLSLSQLPLEPLDQSANVLTRWLGREFPEGYDLPDENISFVFQTSAGYSASNLQAGIIIDDWVEEIPDKIAHTGVAVHYNNPDSEPPQTCLLAVSPDLDGRWSWDDLMDTLSETLQWAKKRAVDPDMLSQTLYAQVLPAIFGPVSASDDPPTLDFGRNIIKKPKPGVLGPIKFQDYILPDITDLDVHLFP